jgi:general secretion pathway protein C
VTGPYDAARMNAVAWVHSFPAPDRWRELALAHGPRVATWTLALLLGIQAALIVTDLTGGSAAPASASTVPAGARPPAHQRINVAGIANGHLFGTAGENAAPADAANAPQTSMPLVLTGIIAGDDPATGLAIVGESASSAKVYGVGDNLPGGAKLHAVYGDRVLIDRNGTVESLVLPRQYAAGGAPAPLPVAAAASGENEAVDRVRRLITDQPGTIADVMRPQPVFAQGKQRGYRVYPGRNRQAFVRLGLRPGDLVTSINGTPLDDPARGQEIFQTLGSSSEAHVTVMRNGRQQDLTLNIAQVAQQADELPTPAPTPDTPPPEPAPNPVDNDE